MWHADGPCSGGLFFLHATGPDVPARVLRRHGTSVNIRVRAITGVVLAAGQSRRMGRSKALLPCPGAAESFVARAVRILGEAGLARVSVIVRRGDAPLLDAIARMSPAPSIVENPSAEGGQLSSLIAGIDDAEASGADAIVVLPVDMPLVQAASIATLLDAVRRSRAPIARVVHAGRSGHPVVFHRDMFDRLRAADPTVGARAVLHEAAGDVLDVPVEDPGVLRDVDLPEEYQQLFDPAR